MSAELQRIADRGRADLERVRDQLVRDIRRALVRLETDPDGELVRSQVRTSGAVLQQINATLVRVGVDGAGVIAAERMAQAADAAVPDDVDVPADAQREIEAILEGRTVEISEAFGVAADEIRIAINAGITTGANLDDLIEAVADRASVAVTRAQTIVDTAIMMAGQRAIIDTAREAVGETEVEVELLYVYEGPDDSLTRPFCDEILALRAAFTEESLLSLDNGQGLPVIDSGGGYNCRHVWLPITRQEAERRGLRIIE